MRSLDILIPSRGMKTVRSARATGRRRILPAISGFQVFLNSGADPPSSLPNRGSRMGTTMNTVGGFAPLRNLRDIEISSAYRSNSDCCLGCQRLASPRAGPCAAKVAIRYVADGNPESSVSMLPMMTETARDLDRESVSFARVGPDDAVLYLMPTIQRSIR